MPETFFQTRRCFNDALDPADAALVEARNLLDVLPSTVAGEDQARQLIDAHQATRETLRTHQRNLEKL